jgi:hypothetical protein
VQGHISILLSTALLAEYREALLRKKIRTLRGLGERDIELLLVALATSAIVREPEPRTAAPGTGGGHLWSLVQSEPNCVLVTGDHASVASPPPRSRVLQPRQFVDLLTLIQRYLTSS